MRELREAARLANRYSLVRRLGEGGMSEIWLARDQRAETLVALKFLKAGLADNKSYREFFHREWTIGSRLMHAHIGRVFEYHDEADGPFYSLQYINGPDLGVLANERPEDALPPFGLLADALRYAHGKRLVHRDIKATNVLLDERGVPHLIDFGVAAKVSDSAASGAGSKIAASPGQREGEPPQTADDIFALGVLLHEILTGMPPDAEAPDRPMQRADGLDIAAPVQDLVRRMLSPEAALRPSAEAVKEQLQAAGYSPAPARTVTRPASSAIETDATTSKIESIRPLPRQTRTARAAISPVVEKKGLRPETVIAALGVLLVLVIGVIFVLPNTVNDDAGKAASAVRHGAFDDDSTAGNGEEGQGDEQAAGIDAGAAEFGENLGVSSADDATRIKIATDEALGDLLSQLERLKFRGIERWGGQPYLDVLDIYAEGDQAYVAKNYATAGDRYRMATDLLDPFYDQIEIEFEKSLTAAQNAFGERDFIEAIRFYDLAVAITPGHRDAEKGLARAISLEAVLKLMEQGEHYEEDLELEAARLVYEKALKLDSAWEAATIALVRVAENIEQMSFDSRMSEGLEALALTEFETARAAFNAARAMHPDSQEPVDGLLQVDQEVRLMSIRTMEGEARLLETNEQWESAVTTYEALLEVDGDLQFAQDGLVRTNSRSMIHRQLNDLIADPDALSDPVNMGRATRMLLNMSRMQPIGPRLNDQKKELSILLKRAATPLPVRMISDNLTEVSVYKVGKLGRFAAQDLKLRPGVYVAVGIRSGYRDVRLEFRVAPEIELRPIVVQCEEAI